MIHNISIIVGPNLAKEGSIKFLVTTCGLSSYKERGMVETFDCGLYWVPCKCRAISL